MNLRFIIRAVDYCVYELRMLPPFNDWSFHTDGDKADADNVRYYIWESEDED